MKEIFHFRVKYDFWHVLMLVAALAMGLNIAQSSIDNSTGNINGALFLGTVFFILISPANLFRELLRGPEPSSFHWSVLLIEMIPIGFFGGIIMGVLYFVGRNSFMLHDLLSFLSQTTGMGR